MLAVMACIVAVLLMILNLAVETSGFKDENVEKKNYWFVEREL